MACSRAPTINSPTSFRSLDTAADAWAGAQSWQPPARRTASLAVAGVSSVLRCPHKRSARFHIISGCLAREEAASIHANARAVMDRQEKERASKQRTRQLRRQQRLGRRAPPTPSEPRAAQTVRTIGASDLGSDAQTYLWRAMHSCLLPFARQSNAFPGVPSSKWDEHPHFLGVRLYAPKAPVRGTPRAASTFDASACNETGSVHRHRERPTICTLTPRSSRRSALSPTGLAAAARSFRPNTRTNCQLRGRRGLAACKQRALGEAS